MSDRNTEIWSTRLQREILALESSDDDSKKIELLPPFIKTTGHTLNIEGGIAKIEFRIDVEVPEGLVGEKAAAETPTEDTTEDKEGGVDNKDENAEEAGLEEGNEGGESKEKGEESEQKADDDAAKDETKPDEGGDDGAKETENAEQADADSSKTEKDEKADTPHVVLVLDASLYWRPDSSTGQSGSPQCYPFQKPLAIVKSGSHLFSGGSTIKDGDEVDIDLDWTPSIHLSDAVTNVALTIRECVKRGEPLHPSAKEEDEEDDGISGSILREAREAKESLLETKKAMGAMFSSGFSSLSAKGSSFAAKSQSAGKSMSKGFLSLGESLSSFAADGPAAKQSESDAAEETPSKDKEPKEGTKKPSKLGFLSLGESLSSLAVDGTSAKRGAPDAAEAEEPKEETKKVVKPIPDIGDEIDLSDEPWNQCVGMYSCKAIKRPAFAEAAMADAAKKQKKEKETSTAGSMFSRFAQSAKSVMEESFLMITDKCIIEFKSNRLTIGSGTVTFAISIDQMAKLKFRREESLSLFFKPAANDPLVYMCLDSALAVQDIQNVLKTHGVKGKHTNAATQRAVQMALNLVALIQQKEKELIDSPTVDRVNEIMDLYRQSAEKFESAGDPRHAEVMTHMKRFLNQQFTTSILDGTFAKSNTVSVKKPTESPKEEKKEPSPVPQGEILEQPTYNLSHDDDDDDDVIPEAQTSKDEAPAEEPSSAVDDSDIQNMEAMLSEAAKDLSDMGMEDDDINNILTSPRNQEDNDDLGFQDDAFAELDAMLSDADKELNEILSS